MPRVPHRPRAALLKVVVTATVAATALGVVAGAASAEPAVPAAPSAPASAHTAAAVPPAALMPAREPAARAASRTTARTCVADRSGTKDTCVSVVAGRPVALGGPTANAIQPVPQWCLDNAFGGIYATRTNACEVVNLLYETYQTVNNVRTLTGQVYSNVFSFAYTSTSLTDWAHQLQVSPYLGNGDALRASMSAIATGSGACTRNSSSFPTSTVTPLNKTVSGESFFRTTATAPGAIGSCTTTWTITFVNAGYPPATAAIAMTPIRCDNATAGNSSVGCVVPWYASALVYSQSSYPQLASHVSRAIASGLPGGSFAAPLTRTTNTTVSDRNRQLACGDAPSVAGKSCDEYPIAQSYQGLTAGGTRRTFDGCTFNLPRATGASGVSVCMITATENNAQGGVNTQFFRRERVLDRDPFRVLIGA